MSGVASWLDATEMDLESEIERLRAEVLALRALWRAPLPYTFAPATEAGDGEHRRRRSDARERVDAPVRQKPY